MTKIIEISDENYEKLKNLMDSAKWCAMEAEDFQRAPRMEIYVIAQDEDEEAGF